eukprot:TRINITY_DN21_c0_g2_i1.p1 TRINITY_DN21_c0_g2~~TRINITY_DN21_c0_g2_i1.p1  ORF type:complete len:278 (+),score=33.59 TRINITY_DN21_c0_g2_i1:181-1014(+)
MSLNGDDKESFDSEDNTLHQPPIESVVIPNDVRPTRVPVPPTSTYVHDSILQRLVERAIPIEWISSRPGGGNQYSYMSATKLIQLANCVFGVDGWNSQLIHWEFESDKEGNGQWEVSCTAHVKVTILSNGCSKEDLGCGSGFNKKKSLAIEKAKKSAVSDGLKRCFRQFGCLLGNGINDKEQIYIETEDGKRRRLTYELLRFQENFRAVCSEPREPHREQMENGIPRRRPQEGPNGPTQGSTTTNSRTASGRYNNNNNNNSSTGGRRREYGTYEDSY